MSTLLHAMHDSMTLFCHHSEPEAIRLYDPALTGKSYVSPGSKHIGTECVSPPYRPPEPLSKKRPRADFRLDPEERD